MQLNNTINQNKVGVKQHPTLIEEIYKAKRKVEVVRLTSKGEEIEVGDLISILHNSVRINVCIAKIDISNNQYIFVVEPNQSTPQISILNGLEICMSFSEADPNILKEQS